MYAHLGAVTSHLSSLYVELKEKSTEVSHINQKLIDIQNAMKSLDENKSESSFSRPSIRRSETVGSDDGRSIKEKARELSLENNLLTQENETLSTRLNII